MVYVRLFGKFELECAGKARPLEPLKARELLAYLLLQRPRAHPRERLASELWGNTSTGKSFKQLRQALWQLRSVLPESGHFLKTEEEWVCLGEEGLESDVGQFLRLARAGEGQAGGGLSRAQVEGLERAAALYRDELLVGWGQEWVLGERERLHDLHLLLLDKLMDHCLGRGRLEAGLAYGERSLALDPAREATHLRLMQLHHLIGDRTAALRQYKRCVRALWLELGVAPSRQTRELYTLLREEGAEAWPPERNLPEMLLMVQSLLQGVQQMLAQGRRTGEAVLEQRGN
ncbi:AfsR/SARP family transcriptional regulator [Calidithermus chliarophilus]|uniref:AfsR/SARP family transcriptional regulator n=1 Tax=Calidithermus chliarophilus TaxID=52023 RepID=UPI00040DF45D|nr:BTAD domain-containing putative transcriptional regulator [Calidithermus chliarophilus]